MNNNEIFSAQQLRLVYTYPADQAEPEKEYQVGGFAAETVLERCSTDSLVRAAVEFEKLRYAFQVIIGRRELGDLVDKEIRRFFQVGRPIGTYEREQAQTSRPRKVPVAVPDFDLELED
jgi:hypothetical protein